jgi:hypothetical protein
MSDLAETDGGEGRGMTDHDGADPARLLTWERPPFFVVGYVRSGTTLFRRMLDMHPELSVLEELDDFQRIPRMIGAGITDEAGLKAFVDALPIFYTEVVYDPDRFLEIAAPRLPLKIQDVISLLKSSARVMADKPGARWGHKEPHEWPYVYRLRDWYPAGQFLHIVRRPHDVAASVEHYNKDIGLHSVSTTPVMSAWHWRTSYRSVRAQGKTLGPKRYFFLRYEDLVDAPAETLGQVAAFLEVSQDGVVRMMEFHKKPLDRHSGAHMTRARQPVSKEAKSRGERSLSEATRRDVDWICRREMAALGYAPLAQDKIGPLRKLTLEAKCLAYDIAWAARRALRRLRGQL